MKKNNLKRFLASLLAVLMLSQVTGVAPGVFAAGNDTATKSEENAEPVFKAYTGEVLIKSGWDNDKVLEALAAAFIENKDSVDISAINWTYKHAVKGTYKVAIEYTTKEAREAIVPVLTGLTEKEAYCYYTGWPKDLYADATYVYPALKDIADGVYELYANGEFVGTINKVAKLQSAINVKSEAVDVIIPFTGATSVDETILRQRIFDAVVTDTTPNLTYSELSYSGDFSEGLNKEVSISYAGNDDYYGISATAYVNFVDARTATSVTIKTDTSVKIPYTLDDDDSVSVNFAKLRENIFNAVVVTDPELTVDDVVITYYASRDKLFGGTESKWVALEGENESYTVKWPEISEGDQQIRVSYVGSADNKAAYAEGTVNFVGRENSTIVLKENASITYSKDGKVEKEDIIKNAIDYSASVLPEGISVDKLKVEQKVGLTDLSWRDISGNTMDAGENQEIRISFAGNAEYKPCQIEAKINVNKAPVSISLPLISKLYAGEEVDPETYYEVTPDDDVIDVYLFFVGVNTNKETCVNVKLTPTQETLLKVIPGVYDKLREGMKLSEFKEFVKNFEGIEIVNNILEILNTFDNLTGNTVIAIGTPAHAGVYQAIAVSPETNNYESGRGTGSLVILKNWKGVKLEKSDLFTGSKNEIKASDAQKIHDGEEGFYAVVLKQNGVIIPNPNAQSAVHYLFTGINNGKLYSKSVMPTEPGRYIVTATVRGGDFFAFPKTFAFTIVEG